MSKQAHIGGRAGCQHIYTPSPLQSPSHPRMEVSGVTWLDLALVVFGSFSRFIRGAFSSDKCSQVNNYIACRSLSISLCTCVIKKNFHYVRLLCTKGQSFCDPSIERIWFFFSLWLASQAVSSSVIHINRVTFDGWWKAKEAQLQNGCITRFPGAGCS